MKKSPLILVFYLFTETMTNEDVIKPFIESIDIYVKSKEYEIMTLFLPTETEERVECINPVIATEEQMEKINSLIADIEFNFSIGDEDGPLEEGEETNE